MSKGLTAIMDGFDGCLLPFAFLIFGGAISPLVACALVVYYSRAGIEGATTPDFVQTIIIALLAILGLGVLLFPVAMWASARAVASRPIIAHPSPSPINVKLTGTVQRAEVAEAEPYALPFDQIPLRLGDGD